VGVGLSGTKGERGTLRKKKLGLDSNESRFRDLERRQVGGERRTRKGSGCDCIFDLQVDKHRLIKPVVGGSCEGGIPRTSEDNPTTVKSNS